jgi:hypothetical protein
MFLTALLVPERTPAPKRELSTSPRHRHGRIRSSSLGRTPFERVADRDHHRDGDATGRSDPQHHAPPTAEGDPAHEAMDALTTGRERNRAFAVGGLPGRRGDRELQRESAGGSRIDHEAYAVIASEDGDRVGARPVGERAPLLLGKVLAHDEGQGTCAVHPGLVGKRHRLQTPPAAARAGNVSRRRGRSKNRAGPPAGAVRRPAATGKEREEENRPREVTPHALDYAYDVRSGPRTASRCPRGRIENTRALWADRGARPSPRGPGAAAPVLRGTAYRLTRNRY